RFVSDTHQVLDRLYRATALPADDIQVGIRVQFAVACRDIGQGDVYGTGRVAELPLIVFTHIEQDSGSRLRLPGRLIEFGRYGLDRYRRAPEARHVTDPATAAGTSAGSGATGGGMPRTVDECSGTVQTEPTRRAVPRIRRIGRSR